MYICICNAVTEREIRQAVELGAASFQQVSCELGVAACCGKCKKDACRVIREQRKGMSAINAAMLPA